MPEAAINYRPTLENQLSGEIIKTLLYFDLFKYPLTEDELYSFCARGCTQDCLNIELVKLMELNLIYKFERFYTLHDDHALIERRIAGNDLAAKRMITARWVSRFISWFPFVRAVMLSGSLSKGYMDKKSDIDFFIITAPGKLWITRTLLVVFKRIFLFNSHRNFCVNYFIDSENLEIEEKNLFTAMETFTLVPTYSEKLYYDFWTANNWIQQYFPNAAPRDTMQVHNGNNVVKRIGEGIFNNKLGKLIDQYFMNMTLNRWKSLFSKKFSKKDFEVAFKTNKHASKNHPRFYQKSILDRYQENLMAYEKNNDIALNTFSL